MNISDFQNLHIVRTISKKSKEDMQELDRISIGYVTYSFSCTILLFLTNSTPEVTWELFSIQIYFCPIFGYHRK